MILVAAAALAVLVGVVYVVLGKGGQLARFEADFPPLGLPEGRPVDPRDLGGLMLPLSLWGYHVRAVDALVLRLTSTLREREERIGELEWRLAHLDPSFVPQGTGPRPGSYLPGDAPMEQDEQGRSAGMSQLSRNDDGSVTEDTARAGTDTASDTVVDPAEYAPRNEEAAVGGDEREERT